jgi:hypothetical protein
MCFYLLTDLKGSIRSVSRPPCYFFIDPSIESNSIDPIQLSNLVFDLLGIHNRFTTLTHLSEAD